MKDGARLNCRGPRAPARLASASFRGALPRPIDAARQQAQHRAMTLTIAPSGQSCGARVTGVDLTRPLAPATVADIRAAWLDHHVLAFPGQEMSDDDLERFTGYFGGFGDDPFIKPIPGRRHVIAVRRRHDETAPLFAENWHSDWSFQARPPAGTCLLGITIPPVGGDTEFSNQHAALDAMPDTLRAKIEGKQAIHSARAGYAPSGMYGANDKNRSMDIVSGDEALDTQFHPIIHKHPETGREGLFGCAGYIIGIDGMDDAEAIPLIVELLHWQGREEFRYTHKWEPDMLILWDNRSVLHRATGGYDGYDRLLHRTTIAAWDEA
jgi:taurine dioxygenase